ncbi:hypothetical protein ASPACDRAFT_1858322 [Aspergillus aculeatus ATCC 16872]|uniref:DUF3669 domain-containing protein n=1 Tax=Aspergillus aculeatus (strain ATCC 16872 / CBS 172.66 / WB 5094) TaxID=690307 RepID=A0A1L9WN19_ASPA1|nr:uncharacterized protein ASPACDRAFT_1858322 [Aspergillus aculeatus ATCC 16872]OJJ97554.1 hypothetical protein ASPACDRAFT_1858322 [Aspergillus aculeatus ATCC 16872]
MTTSTDSNEYYQRIGAGFCGTVWARSLEGHAIKREDRGPSRSLANDFTMHSRAYEAFIDFSYAKRSMRNSLTQLHARIPQCHQYITPQDHSWWEENLRWFPDGYAACNAILSERIPPFPGHIRRLLVDTYCPPVIRQQILHSASNEACLIRPYIGRQRTYGTAMNVRSRFRGFSLRNLPLHVDQMAELGIRAEDVDCYAAMMGEALATLHLIGKIDANDVEFVLAPMSRTVTGTEHNGATDTRSSSNTITNILGTHTMWILDCDLCHSTSMDLKGVQQAVDAFFKNDPFCPGPHTAHWPAFRDRYLSAAEQIARIYHPDETHAIYDLARQFIQIVETRGIKPLFKVTDDTFKGKHATDIPGLEPMSSSQVVCRLNEERNQDQID